MKHSNILNDGFDEYSLGGFHIEMSLDEVKNIRSIYSTLDLLGDVGGLYSILLDVGKILVMVFTFFTGSSMDKYLKVNIFKQKARKRGLPNTQTFNDIEQNHVEA